MMNDLQKKTWKGIIKKGVVFCTIGVMAMGMVACQGKDKKADSPASKTEQSTDKKTDTKDNKSTNKSSSSKSKKKEKTDV